MKQRVITSSMLNPWYVIRAIYIPRIFLGYTKIHILKTISKLNFTLRKGYDFWYSNDNSYGEIKFHVVVLYLFLVEHTNMSIHQNVFKMQIYIENIFSLLKMHQFKHIYHGNDSIVRFLYLNIYYLYFRYLWILNISFQFETKYFYW